MTVRLSKRYGFSASHRLYSPGLTGQENRAIYGKCANPFGHGHDYEVEVTMRGQVHAVTGRIADLPALDRMMEEHVIGPLRYKDLNAQVEAFRTAVPTTENLTSEVVRRLGAVWNDVFGLSGPVLEKVRIRETERNICEIGL